MQANAAIYSGLKPFLGSIILVVSNIC